MSIDPRTLRHDDIVHVRGTLVRIFADSARVQFEGAGNCTIQYKNIVSVETLPIEVGDTVTCGTSLCEYKVAAVDGDYAWVRGFVSQGSIAALADLRHAPHNASTEREP